MIENTEPMRIFTPAFSDAAIPVFMATNGYYAKFTAAALYSLAAHASWNENMISSFCTTESPPMIRPACAILPKAKQISPYVFLIPSRFSRIILCMKVRQ